MRSRDDDVARKRRLESSTQRYPIDRRNERLVEIEAAGESGETARRQRGRSRRGVVLQIVASAKGARALSSEDRDP